MRYLLVCRAVSADRAFDRFLNVEPRVLRLPDLLRRLVVHDRAVDLHADFFQRRTCAEIRFPHALRMHRGCRRCVRVSPRLCEHLLRVLLRISRLLPALLHLHDVLTVAPWCEDRVQLLGRHLRLPKPLLHRNGLPLHARRCLQVSDRLFRCQRRVPAVERLADPVFVRDRRLRLIHVACRHLQRYGRRRRLLRLLPAQHRLFDLPFQVLCRPVRLLFAVHLLPIRLIRLRDIIFQRIPYVRLLRIEPLRDRNDLPVIVVCHRIGGFDLLRVECDILLVFVVYPVVAKSLQILSRFHSGFVLPLEQVQSSVCLRFACWIHDIQIKSSNIAPISSCVKLPRAEERSLYIHVGTPF